MSFKSHVIVYRVSELADLPVPCVVISGETDEEIDQAVYRWVDDFKKQFCEFRNALFTHCPIEVIDAKFL